MNRLITTLLLFAFLANTSAQTNRVVLSFDHKVGANPLVINQTVFSIWNGKKVILTRAEFYLSKMAIVKQDSSRVQLTDMFILANANFPTEYDMGTWNTSMAQSVVLNVGVNPEHNHLDPGLYPQTHPLAYKNPSMHWGWQSGYRFMVVEGKIDNNGDGVPESPFEVHSFDDILYKSVTVPTAKTAVNGVLNVRFNLDYIQLFKNIPMSGSLLQHGSGGFNDKMLTNAVTENFFSVSTATASAEISANSDKISVSPNPFLTETLIQYDLPTTEKLTLVVTNLLGQVVRTVNGLPNLGAVRFEKNDLSTGVYQAAFYEKGNLLGRKKLVISQ